MYSEATVWFLTIAVWAIPLVSFSFFIYVIRALWKSTDEYIEQRAEEIFDERFLRVWRKTNADQKEDKVRNN